MPHPSQAQKLALPFRRPIKPPYIRQLILPGCMSDGETPEEAVINVQDAIATWIGMAGRMGHVVPPPTSYDPDRDRWPARASIVRAG